MSSLNTSLSKGKYEGTLAEISTLEIDKDATYVILDFPVGGITNEQMVGALTESKKKFYQIGSVYTCTSSGTYTQGHSYKFTGSAWVDITPAPDLSNYITTNTAQTITGTKTISDTSLDIEKTNIAGNAKWHLEEDQYAQLVISRTYNNTKQRMLQFNGGNILPEGSVSNLGSTSKLWNTLYLLGNLTDGTNSIPVANITPQSMIGDAYDNTLTYNVGDVVIYNNTLYKCTTAVTVAEDFDSAKWTAITLVTYIQSSGGGSSVSLYEHTIHLTDISGYVYNFCITIYNDSATPINSATVLFNTLTQNEKYGSDSWLKMCTGGSNSTHAYQVEYVADFGVLTCPAFVVRFDDGGQEVIGIDENLTYTTMTSNYGYGDTVKQIL